MTLQKDTIQIAGFIIAVFALVLSSGHATAGPVGFVQPDGYVPAKSLPWPMIKVNSGPDPEEGDPRESVWSSFGEFQGYGTLSGDNTYLHTGIDFRGAQGDHVVVVEDGDIWFISSLSLCETGEYNWACRLYILGEPNTTYDTQYVYYYSHLAFGPYSGMLPDLQYQMDMADTLNPESDPEASETPVSGTAVSRGDRMCTIASFLNDDPYDSISDVHWPHMHFGIFDVNDEYNAISPLTALDRDTGVMQDFDDDTLPLHTWGFDEPMIDDEPPSIVDWGFYRDGNSIAVTPNETNCNEIVATHDLDIVGKIEDTFFTDFIGDPADPAWPDGSHGAVTTGVYEARYLIHRVGSTELPEWTVWNRFDRVPITCEGITCPDPMEPADFIRAAFRLGSGSVHMGHTYAQTLFSETLSTGVYDTTEVFAHILTNAGGVNGNWPITNSTAVPTGLYQVSIEAWDIGGNGVADTQFVFVNNTGSPFDIDDVTPDAYIRDNPVENGGIPSTAGGHPFWTSRDIKITNHGTVLDCDSPSGVSQVVAGNTYDIYLCIHNDGCRDVNNITGRVFHADPSMITESYTEIEDTVSAIATLAPGDEEVLGPFEWTPTGDEADTNNGHRCLMAYIDSNEDHPISPDPNDAEDSDEVQWDNNIAQRNIQVEGDTSSFSILNILTVSADVELAFNCQGFPMAEDGAVVELSVEYHETLHDAWTDVPGTTLTYDSANDLSVLQIHHCNVVMPPAHLPGSTVLPASVALALPSSDTQTYTVHFSEYINSVLRGGMSFSISGYIIE